MALSGESHVDIFGLAVEFDKIPRNERFDSVAVGGAVAVFVEVAVYKPRSPAYSDKRISVVTAAVVTAKKAGAVDREREFVRARAFRSGQHTGLGDVERNARFLISRQILVFTVNVDYFVVDFGVEIQTLVGELRGYSQFARLEMPGNERVFALAAVAEIARVPTVFGFPEVLVRHAVEFHAFVGIVDDFFRRGIDEVVVVEAVLFYSTSDCRRGQKTN